jgi:hypothetical protein
VKGGSARVGSWSNETRVALYLERLGLGPGRLSFEVGTQGGVRGAGASAGVLVGR